MTQETWRPASLPPVHLHVWPHDPTFHGTVEASNSGTTQWIWQACDDERNEKRQNCGGPWGEKQKAMAKTCEKHLNDPQRNSRTNRDSEIFGVLLDGKLTALGTRETRVVMEQPESVARKWTE